MCKWAITWPRELLEQAVAIYRRDLDEGDRGHLAVCLQNLATAHIHLGAHAKAQGVLEEVLSIRQRGHGDAQDCANTLNMLGLVRSHLGDYIGAESRYREALALASGADGNQLLRAACLTNLGGLYESIGDYSRAQRHYEGAVALKEAIHGSQHAEYASAVNNLGYLLGSMGRHAEAETLHRRALAIRAAALGDRHPRVAMSLTNLAKCCFDLGRFQEALDYYRQANDIYMERLGRSHPDTALSSNNLGLVNLALANYAQAEPCFLESLELRRKLFSDGHPALIESLINLCSLYVATDRPRQGLEFMVEAARHDEILIAQVFAIGSEVQRSDYLNTIRKHFDALMSLAVELMVAPKPELTSVCDVALRRKALNAEAIAIRREILAQGDQPHLAEKLEQWLALRTQIAQKMLATTPRTQSENLLLTEWREQLGAVDADLSKLVPATSFASRLMAANTRAVMAAVPAHTALVEYVKFTRFDFKAVPALGQSQWRETRYAAWFFSGRDEARLFDLGPADRIDNQVDAVRDYIVGAGTLNTESAIGAGPRADRHFAAQPAGAQPACAAFAEDLSDLLLKPLGGELAWRPNLLLSPDGNLTRLSFASLPLAEGGYLLDRYCIGYLSAARDILSFRPEDAVGGPALVVADPDFDLCEDSPCASDVVPANRSSAAIRSGLGRFVRLEGTRQEGEAIARMLGVQPLLGSLALDGTIKSSRAPSILHLATHSFFLADPPSQPRPGVDYGILEHLATLDNPLLRSGIALAGINSWLGGKRLPPSAEDGLLTAEDVACLNLRGTRLAVLSACDTGLGQIQVGEGVFGFRRAFALAGVRTLLMSLWKVPDDHTAELMIAFYERVLNNESCADALRQAQRQLAVKHPHLRSWAAFICQGDPGPL